MGLFYTFSFLDTSTTLLTTDTIKRLTIILQGIPFRQNRHLYRQAVESIISLSVSGEVVGRMSIGSNWRMRPRKTT